MPTPKEEVQVYPEPSKNQKARRQPIVLMVMLISHLHRVRVRLTEEQGQPALLLIPEVDRAVPQEERGYGDDKGV